MKRKFLTEFIGTAMLLIGVVGSGIMAENMSGGNNGIALLANAIATGAMLYVIITVLGRRPINGIMIQYMKRREFYVWNILVNGRIIPQNQAITAE